MDGTKRFAALFIISALLLMSCGERSGEQVTTGSPRPAATLDPTATEGERVGDYTTAELREAEDEAMAVFETLGLAPMVILDIPEDRVLLLTANRELFLEEVAAAGLTLPEAVVVQSYDPENPAPSLRGSLETYVGPEGEAIYLPLQGPIARILDVQETGTVILDEQGCLRLDEGRGDLPLILWPPDFEIETDGEWVTVLDTTGRPVAQVGERLFSARSANPLESIPYLPLEACPGPFKLLASIDPLDAKPIFHSEFFKLDDGTQWFFHSQSKPSPETGTVQGTLALVEGCLRLNGYALVWPPSIGPDAVEQPTAIMQYAQEAEPVTLARLGEQVHLAGSERAPDDYRYFNNKNACAGPYWAVTQVLPEAPVE